MNIKRSLLVGAAVATVSLGGLGAVSMASVSAATDANNQTSIVDKLATKFKLNKADVQAVFDEDRTARDADRAAEQKEKLATAVKDGKLTQAQADYITKAQAEITSLRGTAKPGSESDTAREQLKTKMDALRDWAKTNNVDMQYVMGGGPGGHMGGPRGEKGDTMPAAGTEQ